METKEPGPEDAAFWQKRWEQHQTGWDLGGPHPHLAVAVARLIADGLLPKDGKAWVPGCGRAHCAAYLAGQGLDVLATDIVSLAIDEARNTYPQLTGLTLSVDDALALSPEREEAFDLVYDRAVLCAVAPHQRQDFCQSVIRSLRPGGIFLSFPFTETLPVEGRLGPPFGVRLNTLHAMMEEQMTLVSVMEKPASDVYGVENAGRLVSEAVVVYRKRES